MTAAMEGHNNNVPLTAQDTQIQGLRMRYYVAGSQNKPLIVFLHGWGVRRRRVGPWAGIEDIVRVLAEHFYVIAPELPGLLGSQAPDTYEGFEAYTGIVHTFLENIGEHQPKYIMGSSFGGTIAALYARDYPEDVKHLILSNAILTIRADDTHPQWIKWWGRTYQAILSSPYAPRIIKKLIVRLFFGTPWGQITEDELERKKQLDDPMRYVYNLDYADIHVPTLLIWGKDDTKVPLFKAREFTERAPHARLVILSGGHTVLYFRPREVIEIIIRHVPDIDAEAKQC